MKYRKTRDIYDPGVLTDLMEDVISGKPGKEIKKLTTNEMHRLPEIYANLDIYQEDHLRPPLTDWIKDDEYYKTANDKSILGHDIKAITMLMYLKPRTAYWKPDKPQIHDTSVCGAVPIPLLGMRKYNGTPYDSWRPEGTCSVEETFTLDLLLGQTLASTHYDKGTQEICWNSNWGLIIAAKCLSDFRPNYNDVRYYRQYGMGNHTGSFASVYGTAAIIDPGEDNEVDLNYNECGTPMRLMLAQRWAWYGNHRNSDMICDFQDWDNMPKSVDDMSTAMRGITPHEDKTAAMKNLFGMK